MRGPDSMQERLFTMARLEDFVPADHPLRPVQRMVNEALKPPEVSLAPEAKPTAAEPSAVAAAHEATPQTVEPSDPVGEGHEPPAP